MTSNRETIINVRDGLLSIKGKIDEILGVTEAREDLMLTQLLRDASRLLQSSVQQAEIFHAVADGAISRELECLRSQLLREKERSMHLEVLLTDKEDDIEKLRMEMERLEMQSGKARGAVVIRQAITELEKQCGIKVSRSCGRFDSWNRKLHELILNPGVDYVVTLSADPPTSVLQHELPRAMEETVQQLHDHLHELKIRGIFREEGEAVNC